MDSEFSSFFQFLQWDDKLSEPESLDGQQQESTTEPETVAEPETVDDAETETDPQKKNVKKKLTDNNINEKDIKIIPKGEDDLLIKTADQTKHVANRRAEIKPIN